MTHEPEQSGSKPAPTPRTGFLKGLAVPPDFDRMAEDEILELFEGASDAPAPAPDGKR